MTLKPLLCRPPLLPNETLASYLYRLAYANEHRLNIVASLCEEHLFWPDKVIRPNNTETFELLAAITRLEPYKIYGASVYGLTEIVVPRYETMETISCPPGFTFPRMPNKYVYNHFRHEDKAQFCPHCLAEAAYQRRVWQLKMIAACPQHGCLLIDACPNCGQAVKTTDIVMVRCSTCHFDLRMTAVYDVSGDPKGLQTQSILYFWFRAGMHEWASLPRQPVRDLFTVFTTMVQMVWRIRQEMEGHHPAPGLPTPLERRTLNSRMPADYYAAAATAMQALLDWPKGFYSFLDRYARRDGRNFTVSLKSQFDYLFTSDILEQWLAEEYSFVYEALLDYITTRSAYPITTQQHHFQENPISPKRFTWMLAEEASVTLGVTDRTIKRMLAAGLIRVKEETESLRTKFLLKADVMALKQSWQNAIPLADTAVWLGVSEDVVKDLVGVGLLTAVRQPRVAGSAAWQISQDSIESLLTAVHNSAINTVLSGRERVDLTMAAQMLAAYKFNAARVVGLVIKGRLRARCNVTQVLDGLVFNRQDVLMLLDTLREEQGFVSRRMLANRMGVKPDVIEEWIEIGLLTPAFRNDQGTYFSRDDTEAFTVDFVRTKEATRILSVGPLTVQKWTRCGRLQPVSGPDVDGRSVYLFRRSDLERLGPANRLTLPKLARKLGVSEEQVRAWVREGRVRPFSGPGIDDCGWYLFLKDDSLSFVNLYFQTGAV